jgi:hypothetical protein
VSESPTLLYLEADDEITTVVRRVRDSEPGRVVVVAPGRSRATSSAVALRLLARAAEADGRELAVVGDALTRSLAAEAGLAAFASVDDARRGDAPAAAATATAAASHATIHVVRGPATDDAAPTLAAAAVGAGSIGPNDVTRPVPVGRHPRRPPQARQAARGVRALPAAAVAALVLLLAGVMVAGAVLLPAATVTVVPSTEPIGPFDYTVTVTDTVRETGTERATATVTATGTYEDVVAASGTVVLFNWTFGGVFVPAGTFVAAGEQAFATQADVTVPRGRLTLFGTIEAGTIEVAVLAAAPGPAANVEAQAINVVVNESIDAQLRGFPENPEARVVNPQPTSGGIDESGQLITEGDVEAAVNTLGETLSNEVNAQTAAGPDELVVAAERPEPVITGTDGLAGTRDLPEAEIAGTLDWAVLRVEMAAVEDAATERLPAEAALPETEEILPDSVSVEVNGARVVGDAMEVDVRVTASATAVLDPDEVASRIGGMTPDEAQAELADIGEVTVELWPPWVTEVPTMDWRVEVEIGEPGPRPSSSPEPTGSGLPEASS